MRKKQLKMRTKRLYKLLIFGKQKEKLEAIDTLQHLGALHITKADKKLIDQMEQDESLPEVDEISHLLLKLQYIAKATDIDNSFYLEGLPPADKVLNQSRDFIKIHLDKITNLANIKKEITKSKEKFQAQLSLLNKIPFNIKKEHAKDKSHFFFTSTKKIKNIKALHLKKIINQAESQKLYYYHAKIDEGKRNQAKDALKNSQSKKLSLSFINHDTKHEKDILNSKITKTKEKLDHVDKELFKKINGKQSKIKFLIASLLNYREQYNITGNFTKSKNFFALQGFCEGKDVNRIKDALPDASIYVSVAKKGAPTKLKNGPFSENFELITNMFGTPSYGLIDPTKLVTFFFPFFFGFMLSDIGYGLLLLLAVIGLHLHFKEKFKRGTAIFGTSAISSIIFGAFFGSFFGNLIPIDPLLIDGFQGSFNILKIALAIGLFHINLALVLNIYQLILKRVDSFELFLSGAPYILLQLGVVALIIQSYVVAIILLGLTVFALIKKKGIFGIMDITGFFGLWFSYARLLALSLATAGVALAINIIAEKALTFGAIGFVLWLAILVFGHLFNFALNILGCTVHSARLHYVEFFSLFFEGEGHPFKAFKVQKDLEKSEDS